MLRLLVMLACLVASNAYAGAERPAAFASDEAPVAAAATPEPPAPSLAKAYVRLSWVAPTGAVLTVLGVAGGILAFGLDPGPFRDEMRRMAYISAGLLVPAAIITMLMWQGALGANDFGAALVTNLLGAVAMVGTAAAAICIATATAIQSEWDRQAFRQRPVASARIVPTWGRGPGLALVGTI